MYQLTLKNVILGFSFLILLLLIPLYTSKEFKYQNPIVSFNLFSTQEEVEPKSKSKNTNKSNDDNAINTNTNTTQTESNVLDKIRKHWLVPPSVENYNISEDSITTLPAVKNLHKSILEILQFQKNGFFIECGAFDGVSLSNTLHLEMEYNWTGLLIEVDPMNFKMLESKHRKAWIINACLAIRPEEHTIRMMNFINESGSLTIMSEFAPKSYREAPNKEEFDAHCFPLTTLLKALGQKNVDYLSLDIEYAELKVLKTVEWDSVYIKVITLEAGDERLDKIKDYLASKNYKFIKNVKGPWINDNIFVHKQYLEDFPQKDKNGLLK